MTIWIARFVYWMNNRCWKHDIRKSLGFMTGYYCIYCDKEKELNKKNRIVQAKETREKSLHRSHRKTDERSTRPGN